MAKKLGLIVIIVSIFLFYSILSAQSSPTFGPNKYTREKGRPHEFKERFTLCAISGTYKLIVDNGAYTTTEEDNDDEKGKDKDNKKEKNEKKEKKTRISAGEIEINGEEIIKEDDFKKRLARVERTINLPQGENRIEIEIKGKPGTFITVSIECISGCLEPNITFPVTCAVINKTKTVVQGNLANLNGEAGVILQSSGVGGQVLGLAQIQADNFAGIIPLQQGQNTITVQATDACGYKATDTIAIQTDNLQEPIRLTATPSSGILNTTGILPVIFEAEVSIPNPVSNYTWDLNGDGTAEQTGATLSKLTANYQNVGLYFPKVTIIDNQGNTYEETAIINVLSREEMDALLKGKWTSMIDALNKGDTTTALSKIASRSRASYKTMFSVLSGRLSSILATAKEFNFISITDNAAKYKLLTIEGGKTYSYEVIFIKDNEGLWKIREF